MIDAISSVSIATSGSLSSSPFQDRVPRRGGVIAGHRAQGGSSPRHEDVTEKRKLALKIVDSGHQLFVNDEQFTFGQVDHARQAPARGNQR